MITSQIKLNLHSYVGTRLHTWGYLLEEATTNIWKGAVVSGSLQVW